MVIAPAFWSAGALSHFFQRQKVNCRPCGHCYPLGHGAAQSSMAARTDPSVVGSMNQQVWHNYRETRLTYQRCYLARLNYVHQNPVKHGFVPVATKYQCCSAAWFERTASAA